MAQATHPAVAARQVPTPSALQALVVHQAVTLPIRVVAARRLQQDLLLLPVANHLLVLARIAPGTASSTSTGTGQSCCSFATAERSVL